MEEERRKQDKWRLSPKAAYELEHTSFFIFLFSSLLPCYYLRQASIKMVVMICFAWINFLSYQLQ
jgi:hypothetical protein